MSNDNDKQGSGIDWLAYRAEVAKTMLPIIYTRVPRRTGQMRSAEDTAIEDTVNIAINLATLLERRLKE